MAIPDLTSAEVIKSIYDTTFSTRMEEDEGWHGWLKGYVEIIDKVRAASPDKLASPELQQLLWEGNNITGPGMCSIPMNEAIQSQELSQWIAGLRDRELPGPGPKRVDALKQINEELTEKTKQFTNRTPWLKIMRLLAAIYPEDITCVVDEPKLRQLARSMFGNLTRGASDMVTLNAQVLKKLSEVLGPAEHDADSVARRSMFAWELYVAVSETGEEGGEVEGQRPGESQLRFLPNERRTKGLTAIAGYCNTALKVLDFVQNGATVEEAQEFYKQESPQLKDSSVKSQLSVIRHTLGLLKLDGNVLQPSSLGQSLLESENPTLLIPRVLTRVIGFDLILFLLREKSPRSRGELMSALQELYPRWTTQFAPSSLLAWAQALQMVECDNQQNYTLTDTGREWAEQVKEKPKPIKIETTDTETVDLGEETEIVTDFVAPSLEDILKTFESLPYVFSAETVTRLHIALHMHPYKHFVLLSGLSGTGKTRLAKLYAHAYHRVGLDDKNDFYLCVPVQPDWTDPTGLLGYVNPLQEKVTYVGTRFLEFLISAVARPKVPHFLCLDEMNLARVEYYFAPFLSAMESADDIVIHQNAEPVDTIEPRLQWPKNLYVIGTVNMDETTYAFSDKVLDRAFTIEFWEVDLDDFRKRFVQGNPEYPSGLLDFGMSALTAVKDVLEPARQHFGYRTAEEVLTFLGTNHQQGTVALGQSAALDHALLMKVLPKIRGQDSPEFRECLTKLGTYLSSNGLAASAGKIASMKRELELTGTTRFWK
jgi:5-methylcytosine-specific restriction enzyme B